MEETTFVINILVFLIALISLCYQLIERRKGRFYYHVSENVRLIEQKGFYKERMKVLFDDKEVNELNMNVITFFYRGSQVLKGEYVDMPLTVYFKTNKILYADVDQSYSTKTPAKVEVQNDKEYAKVDFNFLNPGDRLSIKLVTDGNVTELNADCRIEGIDSIQEVKHQPSKVFFAKRAVIVFLLSVFTTLLTLRLSVEFPYNFLMATFIVGFYLLYDLVLDDSVIILV